MVYRTFGWVQNPSDFRKLKKTVQVFDSSSEHYKNLRDYLIQDVIYFPEDRARFQKMLDNDTCEFSYKDLVGSSINKEHKSPRKRSDSVANSLLQISILPQSAKTKGKRYTDNWTADGFLRWAVTLNFVSYNRHRDTFKITDFGKDFSTSIDGSKNEQNVLRRAMLSYPPAARILTLLSNTDNGLTKFSIGGQLGFVGEKGFTSYDEGLMIDWLKEANPKERNSIRADVEGTSDKYARMICSWLTKLKFVRKCTTTYLDNTGKKITGFQKYYITGEGKHAIMQANGSSKNKTIPKFVMWEFFATENIESGTQTREYVRTRRAYTLKELRNHHTLNTLLSALKTHNIVEERETLVSDLRKLITFGLRISINENSVILRDTINDFSIPHEIFSLEKKNIISEKVKNEFRRNTNIPERYLDLLDIAFDHTRNRDFEIVTASLFREVYGLKSVHLGGGNKPDGAIFNNKFGIILDTKAYEKGYGKHINQIDEMVRYIEDNSQRDKIRNPNEWWKVFDETIPKDQYYYLWVSGKFLSSFSEQLKQTHHRTNANGGGLDVQQLLLGADAVQKNKLNVNTLPKHMKNEVITLVSPEEVSWMTEFQLGQ